jgi:redox-sensitive bicupin YhaK (pirin superfamily)
MKNKMLRALHVSPEMRMADGFTAHEIGPSNLGRVLDPFVSLTDFSMGRPIFRAHPHAGFSAVTYMFEDSEGTFVNRWSKGQTHLIGPGTLHWTQAGSGMFHEEVPMEPGLVCHGLQMFVRLPTEFEDSQPEAFHLDAEEVPEYLADGLRVRILAGSAYGVSSPIAIRNSLTFLDVHLAGSTSVSLPSTENENSFVYVVSGSVRVGDQVLDAHTGGAFAYDGDSVTIGASSDAEVLFGSGPALNEPYVTEGPFMMSTPERMANAFTRMRAGEMGELAPSF